MEPKRALVVSPIRLGDVEVRPDKYVWRLSAPEGDRVVVEYRGKSGSVPAGAIVESPVRQPGLEDLVRADPCFALAGPSAPRDGAFLVEHEDASRYFSIERCSAHGRRFLRDVRGGVAMYERLTLLLEEEEGSPEEIWSRYHAMSDDWLNLQGRTM